MKSLRGSTVLVLGLGDSGLAMARWCAAQGAAVRVWDSREAPPQAAALAEHVPEARRLSGELNDDALAGVTLMLKSPGLSPRDACIAGAVARAADAGALVQNELDLFVRALAELKAERGYAPKLIAITGTNGKTTTTSMAALLIERTGRRVAMAGNIGPTMLQTLADALALEPAPETAPASAAEPEAEPASAAAPRDEPETPAEMPFSEAALSEAFVEGRFEPEAAANDSRPAPLDDAPLPDESEPERPAAAAPLPIAPPPPAAPVFQHLPEVWVLELSSFQLDEVKGFEPDAATVLNITQDHLDWHGDMAAYVAAKVRVFGPASGSKTVMVINRDDPQVEKLVPATIVPKGRHAKPIERQVVRFGLDAPRRHGDYGLVHEGGMAWLVRALEADETIKRRRGAAQDDEDLHLQRLMPADALRVRGRHNAANALAALALATAIGCPLAPMLHGLRDYTGEPHRVEFIAAIDGVEAFDDSKGTNVGATVAALDGLGADKSPSKLVVILGGDGKGQDFAPLVRPLAQHARAVATLGRDAALIEAAIAGARVAVQRHDTLEAATRWCFAQAQAGDAVLLSPACASFDMFRNYAHRAEVFVSEVKALAHERGGVEA
jgi:UDP-N-acetylmuramoylalanine--D-glutamate ligase